MKTQTETLSLNTKDKIISIALSNIHSDLIFALTKELDLLEIQISTQNIIRKKRLANNKIDLDSKSNIKISPQDKYICITNQKGQYGALYDIQKGHLIKDLDRKTYHTEQSVFPVEFIERDGKTLLIHGSDWNHLDITDIQENKLISKRLNQYQSEFYLDYFYGELHLSPDKKNILSSGWVWGPASVFKPINLDNWLSTNINEPETTRKNGYTIMSYYWDRALCWIDNNTFAFLYDPKEEELDEEDCAEMNIDLKNSYILFYSLINAEIIKSIIFNDYPKNEYFEATSDCKLFFDGNLIFSSDKTGIIIYNIEGKKLYHNNDITLNQFNRKFNLFYKLDDNTIQISKIVAPND